jgi:hypothetical protein
VVHEDRGGPPMLTAGRGAVAFCCGGRVLGRRGFVTRGSRGGRGLDRRRGRRRSGRLLMRGLGESEGQEKSAEHHEG